MKRCVVFLLIMFIQTILFAKEGKYYSIDAGINSPYDFTVKNDDYTRKFRMACLWAPNIHSTVGKETAILLKKLVRHAQLDIKFLGKNKQGRYYGIVKVNGRDINKYLIAQGFAYAYIISGCEDVGRDYLAAEKQARNEDTLIWNLKIRKPWMKKSPEEVTKEKEEVTRIIRKRINFLLKKKKLTKIINKEGYSYTGYVKSQTSTHIYLMSRFYTLKIPKNDIVKRIEVSAKVYLRKK